MAANTANSMLMSGRNFNGLAAGRGAAPPQRPPKSRRELSQELMTMLVAGPSGGTDPVLWTLLLRERPAQASFVKEKRRQPSGRLGFPGFRAFFSVLFRAPRARRP